MLTLIRFRFLLIIETSLQKYNIFFLQCKRLCGFVHRWSGVCVSVVLLFAMYRFAQLYFFTVAANRVFS